MFPGSGYGSPATIYAINWSGKRFNPTREFGAGNGARTRGIKLGKLALYQLSYSRLLNIIKELKKEIKRHLPGLSACLPA